MIKKALIQSLCGAAGTTIGLCLLPRLLIFPELYNDTYPPVWLHALIIFSAGYLVSFIIFLILGMIGRRYTK